MEAMEVRVNITITEEQAKNDKEIEQKMRSLSHAINEACGVFPYLLVEVGNKPTVWTPAQVAEADVIKQIKEQIQREDDKQRRRLGR